MDEDQFQKFLKKGGRSQSAIKRCIMYVQGFERYLLKYSDNKELPKAHPDDLEAFLLWVEMERKIAPKLYL